jgi:NAD(P)-dependent dehydrogenase (short-subunit alcohol dehydrogenase family)
MQVTVRTGSSSEITKSPPVSVTAILSCLAGRAPPPPAAHAASMLAAASAAPRTHHRRTDTPNAIGVTPAIVKDVARGKPAWFGVAPMSLKRFTDQTAIVTGAGSGLGAATARRLSGEGARVACLDVAFDAAEATARDCGNGARAYAVDVSNPEAVREAVGKAAAELGRPSVVVNCAGIGRFYHSHEMPFADWQKIIGVNLTGTFLVCQAALPLLLDGGGCIVNIASNAGLMSQPYSAAYCASKGGVVQLTRALADEYLERGIRVNCVAPGGIATPLQDAFRIMPENIEFKKLAKIRTPLGNAQPDEVAALIAFIASDEGRYMTGAIVSIDGGLTM